MFVFLCFVFVHCAKAMNLVWRTDHSHNQSQTHTSLRFFRHLCGPVTPVNPVKPCWFKTNGTTEPDSCQIVSSFLLFISEDLATAGEDSPFPTTGATEKQQD